MYDVIIIGGGVSGTALAYELSKYQGSVLLLEKENDVANATTKANSGIIHAGYDPHEGSKMAFYNVKGNQQCEEVCRKLDIPFQKIGSLVLAFNDDEMKTLKSMMKRGEHHGVKGLKVLNKEDVLEMEKNVNPDIYGALYAPSAGIVNPWEMAIAFSEVAAQNSVEIALNEKVIDIKKKEDIFTVKTNTKEYKSKIVVNAAGVFCDEINNLVSKKKMKITPVKGDYFVFDKENEQIANHVLFQCPNEQGKGILITPTVDGNILVGPTATIGDKEDVSVDSKALDFIKESAKRIMPNIKFSTNIRNFSGIRAREENVKDFIIGEDETVEDLFHIAGMQSPGLSSAIAIAEDIMKMIQEKGVFKEIKLSYIDERKVIRLHTLSDEEKEKLIKENPKYGNIICRCEQISEQEILNEFNKKLVPQSIDAIKKRCRPGAGRCQGGFCGVKIHEILSKELKIKFSDVVQDKKGSFIAYDKEDR